MRVTLTNTSKIVTLTTPDGDVPARIWEGVTDSGITVHAYITRIAVAPDQDTTQFQRELQECARPTPAIAALPVRLIL